MQNKKDVMVNGPPEPNRRKKIGIILLAAVIVLAAGGSLLYKKHTNQSASKTTNKSVTEVKAEAVQQELKDKDYKSYQIRLSTDAADLIAKGNYSDAQKILDEIVKNVPTDKIISQTYTTYWSLYDKKGDVQNRKKYDLLASQKLKAEGQAGAAADYEEDANRE